MSRLTDMVHSTTTSSQTQVLNSYLARSAAHRFSGRTLRSKRDTLLYAASTKCTARWSQLRLMSTKCSDAHWKHKHPKWLEDVFLPFPGGHGPPFLMNRHLLSSYLGPPSGVFHPPGCDQRGPQMGSESLAGNGGRNRGYYIFLTK